MVMLDFIYMDTAELFGTGREIQNENISSVIRTHATPPDDRWISALDRSGHAG